MGNISTESSDNHFISTLVRVEEIGSYFKFRHLQYPTISKMLIKKTTLSGFNNAPSACSTITKTSFHQKVVAVSIKEIT
jgi:hypothetical protein